MTLSTIARVGIDTVGGGLIVGGGQSTVYFGNYLIAVHGDVVASHPRGSAGGPSTHNGATVIGGSNTVEINGKKVVRHGDLSSCNHSVVSSINPGSLQTE